jgi:hypothetical protein
MIDPRTIVLRAVLLLAGSGIGMAACAGATNRVSMDPVPPTAVVVEADPADASLVPRLSAYAGHGVERIETYFGAPFPAPVRIRVFSGRAEMDAYMREAWGMQETACWMVGGAEEGALILLSPRVWREEACDHDPDDEDHVRDLVAHELVHVYHMQRNSTHEFDGVEGLDWFVEGLATFVSGQYERFHMNRAREAIDAGAAPAGLEDAWTGSYRYGVSGSLVAYLESRLGRSGIGGLLAARHLDEVLAAVGMTEPQLLAAWAEWVRG